MNDSINLFFRDLDDVHFDATTRKGGGRFAPACRLSPPVTRARGITSGVIVAAALFAPPTRAAHSDIIVSHSNGVLQVDATIHTGDVRENDAGGTGTVWATDNPGFAGTRFRFNDEIHFDITGPLRRWNGTNWSTADIGAEYMQFVEPGPFGNSLNSVTITSSTSFAPGYRIAQVGTRGTLHTHFVFILRATNGLAPAIGAWSNEGAPFIGTGGLHELTFQATESHQFFQAIPLEP